MQSMNFTVTYVCVVRIANVGTVVRGLFGLICSFVLSVRVAWVTWVAWVAWVDLLSFPRSE